MTATKRRILSLAWGYLLYIYRRSNRKSNHFTVHFRNVTDNGYENRLQEWKYLDGTLFTESVGYLCIDLFQMALYGRLTAGFGIRSQGAADSPTDQ
jgi:hypothetical protein